MKRQEQDLVLRLWKDWCRVWPEQYGHESLQVKPEGYDPVFDLIPSQAYKDFYYEVVAGHPSLRHLNAFEVIDTTLNQVRAPEMPPKADETPAHEDVDVAAVAEKRGANEVEEVLIDQVAVAVRAVEVEEVEELEGELPEEHEPRQPLRASEHGLRDDELEDADDEALPEVVAVELPSLLEDDSEAETA